MSAKVQRFQQIRKGCVYVFLNFSSHKFLQTVNKPWLYIAPDAMCQMMDFRQQIFIRQVNLCYSVIIGESIVHVYMYRYTCSSDHW